MRHFLFVLTLGIIACFLNVNLTYNLTFSQEAQATNIESNDNEIVEQLKEKIKQLEAEFRRKEFEKYPEEVNKPEPVFLTNAEMEKIIAQQIKDDNIRYKDRIFGNSFKGLAMSIKPKKDEYEIGNDIRVSILFKNFSQKIIEFKHNRTYGYLDDFRYAMYFPDGHPVQKSELIEEYEAKMNKPELLPSRISRPIYRFEPMRILAFEVDVNQYFKIEKEGIYTLVMMRRISHSWEDGFMISNMTKINIVKKTEEK